MMKATVSIFTSCSLIFFLVFASCGCARNAEISKPEMQPPSQPLAKTAKESNSHNPWKEVLLVPYALLGGTVLAVFGILYSPWLIAEGIKKSGEKQQPSASSDIQRRSKLQDEWVIDIHQNCGIVGNAFYLPLNILANTVVNTGMIVSWPYRALVKKQKAALVSIWGCMLD